MAGNEEGLPEVYVQPGESHLIAEPAVMRTVLGSCVGVTFWAPRLGLSALCHPMLPVFPVKSVGMSRAQACRYVDFAIRDLVRQFDQMGARRAEVQVKLFGGGDVLPALKASARGTVGQLNRQTALRVLEEEGYTIAAQSLGGTCGINILFHTGTGEVLLRRLC
jgi:chemotaxis protein CheD